jgi:polysaccharide export outer membrane protein
MHRGVMVWALVLCAAGPALGQTNGSATAGAPENFIIGVEDVLDVTFWRDEELSGEVIVRPDGKISLPLVNEVQAAGLTTEQLRESLETAAAKFLTDPTVGVSVKAINSRRVHIVGQVAKQGFYSVIQPTTVMELITMAGGPLDWANTKKIRIARMKNGTTESFVFNYKDFVDGKNLDSNILLEPGDIVTVPD